MRIIIIGAGEVGAHIASQLTEENHDITLIEANPKKAQAVQDAMDIMVVRGNGASPSVLKEAGIEQCDLFLAVTNKDEINMLASLTASRFNVPFKIARVSNMDFYDLDNFLSSKNLGTDLLINPEFECALQVANLLKVPGATEYAEFAGGEVLLFGLTLGPDAPCLDRSLQELRQGIGEIKFLVCSITRGTKTLVPSGKTVLQADDQVYFIAHRQDLDEVYAFCGIKKTRIKRVMVLGGSRVANYLCHIFEKKNIRAILIEPNEARAEELAEELTNTLIINGDVKDLELLTQEGLHDSDCFLALTPADEDNMLTGIFAKNQKVPHVITLLGKHEYMPVFKKIGVQISVSPRLEVTNTILKFVREGNITAAVTIQNNQTEIMEFQVNKHAEVRGKRLRDIKLPKDVLFAMVHRNHADFIPTGNTILQEGDHVVAMTLAKEHRKLERLFL